MKPDILILEDADSKTVPLGFLDTANTQKLDGNSASDQTTVINANVASAVLITAPEAYHLEIGTDPTATTNSVYIPAGMYEVALRKGYKVAVIKASGATAGDVWVTPYGGFNY